MNHTLDFSVKLFSTELACILLYMVRASIDDFARDLAGYFQRVAAGETVLVTQFDQPVAEIKPVVRDSSAVRPFGLCAGEFTVPEDFDSPLPDEILSDFDGK